MIPYGHQWISEDDIAAVEAVLRSDFLTQGPAIERFETSVAEYCGAAYAVAVCNGTAALHLSCLALGLGAGSLLWTSPNTFVASANCARYVGADVNFVDIDPDTYNMSVDALAAKLERAERAGRLPTAVAPVHFGGASCDMAAIGELARKYNVRVLEDASHAIGGRYGDARVGSCEHSDMAVFSFHPVKIVTSGEGGMVVTNNAEIASYVRDLRTHGITRDTEKMRGVNVGGWYYEQLYLGLNYRMTDIQAALGTSQMTRIDEFVTRRNEIAARYIAALDGLPVRWQQVPEGVYSAYHLFVIELEQHRRAVVYDALREAGIGVNVHYIPVHLQPYYIGFGFSLGMFPNAEAYYERALTLPLYPAMTDADVDTVLAALASALA
ncbi:MAG: UDP-4-amino-4,6-dideoxy-N-acetyl-beta-L-altrosamine transaminase [Coriobacteriia bacterium]|nr:UDP-4-amino-4,6-dideoxy-N-acetyl-beta-L-altrosamine transaminase [Coriobacteriia bacterium]